MQIHQLRRNRKQPKRRVGRGGKRGTTSGKGQKGQKSRSGRKIRPAVRDLIQRLPKRRGLKNPKNPKPQILQVGDLTKIEGVVISRETLRKAGLIKSANRSIKILGEGKADRAFTVEGVALSEKAKVKIEKAGGKIASKK